MPGPALQRVDVPAPLEPVNGVSVAHMMEREAAEFDSFFFAHASVRSMSLWNVGAKLV
jgi:hypothetical protein